MQKFQSISATEIEYKYLHFVFGQHNIQLLENPQAQMLIQTWLQCDAGYFAIKAWFRDSVNSEPGRAGPAEVHDGHQGQAGGWHYQHVNQV